MKKICVILLLLLIFTQFQVYSKNARSYYNEGYEEYLLEKYDEAIIFLKKSIQLNPNYLDPIFLLAKIYYQKENFDYSYKYINDAAKLAPGNTDIILIQADIETALQMYDIAEQKYKSLLQDNPLHIKAYNGLSYLYLKTDNSIMAKKNLENVLKTAPDNFDAIYLTAKYYEKKGNNKLAEEYYLQNIEKNSLNPDSYYYYSLFNFNKNKILQAVQNIETAINLKQKIKYHKSLGQYLLFLNQPDKALKIFKELIKKEKNSYLLFYDLSHAYYKLSNYERAVLSLQKVLNMREDDEISAFFLNNILYDNFKLNNNERQKRALYYFNQSMKAKKEAKYNLYFYFLKESIRLNPRLAKARVELAEYYIMEKLPERSLRELIVASQYDNNRELKDRIEIEKKKIIYRLGNDWDLKQYRIENDLYKIPIFLTFNINNTHFNCESIYLDILKKSFSEKRKYDLVINEEKEYTAYEKMEVCKSLQTPFYINLGLNESGNTFEVTCQLFNALNNEAIKKYNIITAGNDKVVKSAISLFTNINDDIPFKAHILKIKKNRAIINAGRRSGVALKDRFVILENKNYLTEFDNVMMKYLKSNIKGYATAVKVDENLTELIIEDNDYYNDIDIDDIVIYQKK